jgi:phage nucleotide-binding protein
MQYSHSRIECFENCKFQYKLRYIDGIKTIPSTDSNNSLILGLALHKGIEENVQAGISLYYNSFPVIDDEHINEVIKFEYLIPKIKEILPIGANELPLTDSDFIGFIDYVSLVDNEIFDLWDFKYSNNIKNYLESEQLHLYKYFFEKQSNKKVRNLNYMFIPKINIKPKKGEDLRCFRNRIVEELEKSEIKVVTVEYDPQKVIEFYSKIKAIQDNKDYPKEQSYLCNYCEYQDYCTKGEDYMLLPKNERRNIEKISKKVVWLYGVPFCGKTYLANQFPDPLMLNTDGNIKFVDSPYISIKDQVTVEGRMTKRKLAWEVFKETIDELEKKQNDFKTIVVDLLEDTYEHCRLYMYDQMGITHESDDSFRAWDKVRTEFLSTLKRLMNLDYENIILISHEDTSKDITKKGGDKVTAIKPNLQEKAANKVAGMVDIVARVVADGEERSLSFKTNEVIFGGGRLTVTQKVIPLNYNEFMKVYDEANRNVKGQKISKETKPVNESTTQTTSEKATDSSAQVSQRDSFTQKVQKTEQEQGNVVQSEPQPERKTRKRRGE